MGSFSIGRKWQLALVAAAAVICTLVAGPGTAAALDEYPCGKEVSAAWSKDPVQPCPLTSPTGPNSGIPVYASPIANPAGRTPPAPLGWLHGVSGKYFVCDKQFPQATFHHPTGGWFNNWWAYTRSDEGRMGWVPEAYFKGGDNNEPDYGLRNCPPPQQPPPPAPPAPPVSPCEPTPLTTGVTVKARFRKSRRTVVASFGRKLPVSGQLRNADGTPLAGASVCVGVQDAANAPVRQVSTVTTDAEGRFRYRLGSGVSRRVWFVHRVGGGAAAGSVVARVRAPIALRASRRSLRNGESVLLKGRLRRAAARGLLVEMQAARGRGWQTFATTRTGRGGRFSYRYRFTRTFGVQRYRLRARIPAQPGSRFATGGSRPVRVQVAG